MLKRDTTAGADAIFDNDAGILRAQLIGDQAGDRIDGAARRESGDQAEWRRI